MDTGKCLLSTILEEYKTIRDEGMTAIKNQQNILQFGLAGVVALIVAGFSIWNNRDIAAMIFMLVIPLINYIILTLWYCELIRMIRASFYIKTKVEPKINKLFNDKQPALEWENWLGDFKTGISRRTSINYMSVFCLFAFLTLISIIIGNVILKLHFSYKFFIYNGMELIFFFVTYFFLYKYWISKEFLKI